MKIILVANSDWFHYRFNRELCRAIEGRGDELLLVAPTGPYLEKLREEGLRCVHLPIGRRSVNPLRELRTLASLWRTYSRERPDLVHHLTLKCALYGSLAARLAGVRAVVNSITGLGYVFGSGDARARLLRPFVGWLARWALRGTRVIFLNRDDLEELRRRRAVGGEQSRVVPGSGVDTDRFRPLPEAAGEPVVALVGRMLRDKGVEEFVEAARLLAARGVRARWVLVGGTDPENPAAIPRARLEGWQRHGPVEWWGFREEMIEVYAAATVVCLPAYREGVPTALLEAAACERPLVASDVPGCREVVRHGENGLLVPPRDSEALAAAVERLLADRRLRRAMGSRGREIVVETFSVERVVGETLATYRQAGCVE